MRKIILASLLVVASFNAFANGNGTANAQGPGAGYGAGSGMTHEEYLKCDPVAMRYSNQCHFAKTDKKPTDMAMEWPLWVRN
jgi:hypothetical protein